MITNLKAVSYKGIKSIELNDLSKLNIVCGKNNSGKSSILEGLSSNGVLGLSFCSFEKFYEEFNIHISGKDSGYYHRIKEHFDRNLSDYFNDRGNTTVYEDDITNFSGTLYNIYFQNHILRNHINLQQEIFRRILNAMMLKQKQSHHPVLIPAKRNLEFETSINLDSNLMPDGLNLLNHLFYLKNKDHLSEEQRLFQNILSEFRRITNYEFNVVPRSGNKIHLSFRIGNNWLDAEQCGLGLRELLFMITYIYTTNSKFVFLEEPENHLHADFQKKFISFLKEIADKQFLIATHSNVFIDSFLVDKIYYCWYDSEIKVSDKTSVSKIIDSLGYSIAENLVSDVIILTEGPTDIPILKRILTLNDVLTTYNVKFLPLGGDIMAHIDLSLFGGLDKVFAVIDNDPGSSKIRQEFLKHCREHKITCFKLKRYSIENYFPLSVLKEQFMGLPDTLSELDHGRSIDEQIGFKAKNKTIKQKNHELASKLQNDDVIGTDLFDSMNKIKEFLKTTSSKN